MVLRRHSTGATLEEIGQEHGLTRERVRQIVGHCSRHWVNEGLQLPELEQLVSRVADGNALFFKDGPDAQTLQVAVEVIADAAGAKVVRDVLTRKGFCIVYSEAVRDALPDLERILRERAEYLRDETFTHLAKVKPSVLPLYIYWSVNAYRSRAGLIGYRNWSRPDIAAAISWELALSVEARTWHASEMAKAIQYVLPDVEEGLNVKLMFATLNSSHAKKHFQNTTERGHHGLRTILDGFDHTVDAVRHHLSEAGGSLAVEDLFDRLSSSRPGLAQGTLYAALSISDEFDTNGQGSWRLKQQQTGKRNA